MACSPTCPTCDRFHHPDSPCFDVPKKKPGIVIEIYNPPTYHREDTAIAPWNHKVLEFKPRQTGVAS